MLGVVQDAHVDTPPAVRVADDVARPGRARQVEAQAGDARPPSALFCANDQIAIGAMRVLRERGLAIPGDVAIVGYDDVSVASELITPLTSVRQPMAQIGRAAADLLLADGDSVAHVVFPPELVVRESTVGR